MIGATANLDELLDLSGSFDPNDDELMSAFLLQHERLRLAG